VLFKSRGFSVALSLLVANLIVVVWLLTIVHRQRVRKQLPWFVLYVAWGVLLASVQLAAWIISPQLYVAVYWWMELVAVALIVAAVRESFLRIFQGFTSKRGFRLSVWTMIVAVVIYSAWKAIYAPPVQSTRLGSFVVGAEFAFRWGIFGIALLTAIFSLFLREPMDTREDAVIAGFGLASFGVLAGIINFSLFGTKYLFFTKYAPSVGYFLAVFWWIWVFSRPVTEFGFKELGMGPEDIAKELRRYRELTERMMRKRW
jgi:hypothetical protein